MQYIINDKNILPATVFFLILASRTNDLVFFLKKMDISSQLKRFGHFRQTSVTTGALLPGSPALRRPSLIFSLELITKHSKGVAPSPCRSCTEAQTLRCLIPKVQVNSCLLLFDFFFFGGESRGEVPLFHHGALSGRLACPWRQANVSSEALCRKAGWAAAAAFFLGWTDGWSSASSATRHATHLYLLIYLFGFLGFSLVGARRSSVAGDCRRSQDGRSLFLFLFWPKHQDFTWIECKHW